MKYKYKILNNSSKILSVFLMLTIHLYAKNYVVNQKSMTFIPKIIHAKVGDTITFKNSDNFIHNAYTNDKNNAFDTGMQRPHQDKTISIKSTGKFNIKCALHPKMLLKVIAK